MGISSNKVIRRETEKKPDQQVTDEAKQIKESGPEACASDALMCPCFPHINIEVHVTGKSELNK